ncbi:MAG: hypothetical protein V7K88_06035 [Nostoc sp.]|uniref:hypothetical protein n=1 Tax=Nostoc sp. TaxID=1180 RepID=UPI002FF9D812
MANGKKTLNECGGAKGLIYGAAESYDTFNSPQIQNFPSFLLISWYQHYGIMMPEWELNL